MIRTIARVVRAEGMGSAMRRTRERAAESLRLQAMLARGAFARDAFSREERVPLLNVSGMPPVARLGGLPIQLRARLDEERASRDVALFYPSSLWSGGLLAHRALGTNVLEVRSHARRVRDLEDALARTGARTIHLEGTFGVPLDAVLRLPVEIILSLHDLSLFDAPRATRQELLDRARVVIFPSEFLREKYGVAGHVIEPASAGSAIARRPGVRTRIAYAGSLKRHKGAHLLPEIIAGTNAEWHLFGGGDEGLQRAVRGLPRVTAHGYYRAGTLPSLLARHRIGLAVLPSIVPESFGLTLSECWRAGVPAVAFAHGALAERIARHGGGWVVPLGEGAAGIASVVGRWVGGELETKVPSDVASPRDAAAAHLALYHAQRFQ